MNLRDIRRKQSLPVLQCSKSMIFTHQVMMFKLVSTSIKQIHRSVHFTHNFCSGNVYHFGVI